MIDLFGVPSDYEISYFSENKACVNNYLLVCVSAIFVQILPYLLIKHRAALFNQTNIIEFLLDKEAKLDARDNDGRSPFLNAVAAGHVESACLLLNRGADISATDLLMKTCVHIAVENEHLNMVVMLLGKCAGVNNLNKGDMLGKVPLHYAATTDEIKVLLKDPIIRLNQ